MNRIGICGQQLPGTPKRRVRPTELLEEKNRLGFGETPLKEMPALSPCSDAGSSPAGHAWVARGGA
jgi:hypothetical protein